MSSVLIELEERLIRLEQAIERLLHLPPPGGHTTGASVSGACSHPPTTVPWEDNLFYHFAKYP